MKLLRSIKDILLQIFLICLAASCGDDRSIQPDAAAAQEENHTEEDDRVSFTGEQFKTAGIEFGTVEMKQISGTFKANGVLDVPPQNQVSISVPMGGFLKKTDLLQGMRVKKGQLIAVIENPEYVQIQQDYLEAKSQLEYAKADYERQEELAKENINALKTLQQAKSTYQILTARVNGLKEKMKVSGIKLASVESGTIQSAISIYSPISGFVTEINANIGKFIKATDVLFEIVDTEHLHAELTVFEKDVPKLQIGQHVRFTLANETTDRTARVYLIGREISDDRTVRVHCHIDKEDIHMLPGMYLKATVETGQAKAPSLPDEAIVDYQGQKYIFVAAEEEQPKDTSNKTGPVEAKHHFKMIAVQTGNRDGGYTEVILPGQTDRTAIAIKGAYALLSKMKNSEEDEGHGH